MSTLSFHAESLHGNTVKTAPLRCHQGNLSQLIVCFQEYVGRSNKAPVIFIYFFSDEAPNRGPNLPSLGSHLVEVLQQRRLLLHEELAAGVGGVLLLPEGADVDAGRLGDVDQRCHAPEEGAVHPHQVLRGEAVGLVEDEADLRLAALHLPEEHLQLAAHVQLGGVEDQEDQVGPVDEPLAHLVVGVTCGGGEDMRGGWPSITMNLVATFSEC